MLVLGNLDYSKNRPQKIQIISVIDLADEFSIKTKQGCSGYLQDALILYETFDIRPFMCYIEIKLYYA